MRIKKLLAAVLAGGILLNSGCSLQKDTGEYENSIFVLNNTEGKLTELEFMEAEPVIVYVKPETVPNLIVDRYGYSKNDELMAYVQGVQVPEQICVKEKKSQEIVYRGGLQNVIFDEKTKKYFGEFSFLIPKEGTYFIQCEQLGKSYPFRVENEIYKNLAEELYTQITSASEKDSGAVEELLLLLLACEWHPGICEDKDGNGVPDVLDYIKVWIRDNDFTDMKDSKISLYAAFLAKYSYLYRQYDLTYATECLHMASTIFVKTKNEKVKSADQFFALTELYRATGLAVYGDQILEYQAVFREKTEFYEEPSYLYGVMTYFLTRQEVDTSFCNMLMQKLLTCGETAAKECESLLESWRETTVDPDRLLYMTRQLSCANYVLESMQYSRIMGDVMHYLMGRNPGSRVYYSEADGAGMYFLLAAELAALDGI